MGGAEPVVTGVTAKCDLGSVFIARSVNDLPLAVVQREGADTRAHHDCGIKRLFRSYIKQSCIKQAPRTRPVAIDEHSETLSTKAVSVTNDEHTHNAL